MFKPGASSLAKLFHESVTSLIGAAAKAAKKIEWKWTTGDKNRCEDFIPYA